MILITMKDLDSRLIVWVNSPNRKKFSSLKYAGPHNGLSSSGTLAELAINRRKPGRPINSGSGITKQAPLHSGLPQPELPQLLNQPEKHHL